MMEILHLSETTMAQFLVFIMKKQQQQQQIDYTFILYIIF